MKFRLIETNYFEGRKSRVMEDFETKAEIIKLARKFDGMTNAAMSNLSMFGHCEFEHNGLVKSLEIKMEAKKELNGSK